MALQVGDTVTVTRAVTTPGGHGFEVGEKVMLVRFDHEGDPVFSNGEASYYLEPEDYGLRVVEVTREQERELVAAAQAAENATKRDSNDAEIEALREAYESAFAALGITIPEGAEPCDYCEGSQGEHETDDCPGIEDD